MADLPQHYDDSEVDQQYEFGGLITSIFQHRGQASDEGLIDCLHGALQDIISEESEEYQNAKKILEKDRCEAVDLKNLEPCGVDVTDVGPSLGETENKNLSGTCSNSRRKNLKDNHFNIEMGEENNFEQEHCISAVSDVSISINNSASSNAFDDSQSSALNNKTMKTSTSEQEYHIASDKSEDNFIKKTLNHSSNEDSEKTLEQYRIIKTSCQEQVRCKSSCGARDSELSSNEKNINYSANGQDSAFKQEDGKSKTIDCKMEAAGVKDPDPPGDDIDDTTAVKPKDQDKDVSDQTIKLGGSLGEPLTTEGKDQTENKGESFNQTEEKQDMGSRSLRKEKRKDINEMEKDILTTEPKRKQLEEDEVIENPQEQRKQKQIQSEFCVNNGLPAHGSCENTLFAEDSSSEESVEKLSLKDIAFGNEGYKHFKLYAEIDKNVRVSELEEAKDALKMNYDWRIQQIDEIIDVAREYYKNPKNRKAATEWHELKKAVSVEKRSTVKSNTDIKFHLASLHEHRTIFTYILIAMQLVSVIVTCVLGKLTYIGLEPKLELLSGMRTFMGTEMVHKWIPPNLWIGPTERYLITIGALYAPCMREDFGIQIAYSKEGYSKTSTLGCCEVASRNVAGTTTLAECVNGTNGVGVWKEGVLCSDRPSGQNSVGHVLKPCCTGLRGQCQLLSHEHCQFLGGSFHIKGPEHCSQVNCLSSVCGMGGLDADPIQPWLPQDPKQWWRLPLSLVYHHGLIHAVVVSLAQLLLFRKIERTLGWLRLSIVYLVTGLGGLLTAAIFTPYLPHVGGTASVFGMAGLITAELIHYWHIVKKPAVELTKIGLLLFVFLMLGTLPYIDNYSIVSGFLLGVICSVLFLPFLSFRQQQKHCRIILLFFGAPLIFLVYFVLFYVFCKVQTFEECSSCKLFNCVPYTETMCDLSLWTYE